MKKYETYFLYALFFGAGFGLSHVLKKGSEKPALTASKGGDAMSGPMARWHHFRPW